MLTLCRQELQEDDFYNHNYLASLGPKFYLQIKSEFMKWVRDRMILINVLASEPVCLFSDVRSNLDNGDLKPLYPADLAEEFSEECGLEAMAPFQAPNLAWHLAKQSTMDQLAANAGQMDKRPFRESLRAWGYVFWDQDNWKRWGLADLIKTTMDRQAHMLTDEWA